MQYLFHQNLRSKLREEIASCNFENCQLYNERKQLFFRQMRELDEYGNKYLIVAKNSINSLRMRSEYAKSQNSKFDADLQKAEFITSYFLHAQVHKRVNIGHWYRQFTYDIRCFIYRCFQTIPFY